MPTHLYDICWYCGEPYFIFCPCYHRPPSSTTSGGGDLVPPADPEDPPEPVYTFHDPINNCDEIFSYFQEDFFEQDITELVLNPGLNRLSTISTGYNLFSEAVDIYAIALFRYEAIDPGEAPASFTVTCSQYEDATETQTTLFSGTFDSYTTPIDELYQKWYFTPFAFSKEAGPTFLPAGQVPSRLPLTRYTKQVTLVCSNPNVRARVFGIKCNSTTCRIPKPHVLTIPCSEAAPALQELSSPDVNTFKFDKRSVTDPNSGVTCVLYNGESIDSASDLTTSSFAHFALVTDTKCCWYRLEFSVDCSNSSGGSFSVEVFNSTESNLLITPVSPGSTLIVVYAPYNPASDWFPIEADATPLKLNSETLELSIIGSTGVVVNELYALTLPSPAIDTCQRANAVCNIDRRNIRTDVSYAPFAITPTVSDLAHFKVLPYSDFWFPPPSSQFNTPVNVTRAGVSTSTVRSVPHHFGEAASDASLFDSTQLNNYNNVWYFLPADVASVDFGQECDIYGFYLYINNSLFGDNVSALNNRFVLELFFEDYLISSTNIDTNLTRDDPVYYWRSGFNPDTDFDSTLGTSLFRNVTSFKLTRVAIDATSDLLPIYCACVRLDLIPSHCEKPAEYRPSSCSVCPKPFSSGTFIEDNFVHNQENFWINNEDTLTDPLHIIVPATTTGTRHNGNVSPVDGPRLVSYIFGRNGEYPDFVPDPFDEVALRYFSDTPGDEETTHLDDLFTLSFLLDKEADDKGVLNYPDIWQINLRSWEVPRHLRWKVELICENDILNKIYWGDRTNPLFLRGHYRRGLHTLIADPSGPHSPLAHRVKEIKFNIDFLINDQNGAHFGDPFYFPGLQIIGAPGVCSNFDLGIENPPDQAPTPSPSGPFDCKQGDLVVEQFAGLGGSQPFYSPYPSSSLCTRLLNTGVASYTKSANLSISSINIWLGAGIYCYVNTDQTLTINLTSYRDIYLFEEQMYRNKNRFFIDLYCDTTLVRTMQYDLIPVSTNARTIVFRSKYFPGYSFHDQYSGCLARSINKIVYRFIDPATIGKAAEIAQHWRSWIWSAPSVCKVPDTPYPTKPPPPTVSSWVAFSRAIFSEAPPSAPFLSVSGYYNPDGSGHYIGLFKPIVGRDNPSYPHDSDGRLNLMAGLTVANGGLTKTGTVGNINHAADGWAYTSFANALSITSGSALHFNFPAPVDIHQFQMCIGCSCYPTPGPSRFEFYSGSTLAHREELFFSSQDLNPADAFRETRYPAPSASADVPLVRGVTRLSVWGPFLRIVHVTAIGTLT